MHITVIIPTFNCPNDLEKTLDSIQQSSIFPNSIILIDQSTNAQTEIMLIKKRYKHLHYIKSSIQSYAKARNIGIQYLDPRAELVIFLNDNVVVDS